MHIIRHLKGKQCIFTRHVSPCAQTGAISASTEGKCIVIDCYKRLPSSRGIKLFQNCIWRLKALCKESSLPISQRHTFAPTCSLLNNYRALFERCSLLFFPQKCVHNPFARPLGPVAISVSIQGLSLVYKSDARFLNVKKYCQKKLFEPISPCNIGASAYKHGEVSVMNSGDLLYKNAAFRSNKCKLSTSCCCNLTMKTFYQLLLPVTIGIATSGTLRTGTCSHKCSKTCVSFGSEKGLKCHI